MVQALTTRARKLTRIQYCVQIPTQKDGELQTFGLNIKYDITDEWSLTLDVADSESNKRDLRGESYAGLARSGALGKGN